MNEINNLPCKECGEPVPQTKGKRPKEYCSVACRSNNWQKRQREQRESNKILNGVVKSPVVVKNKAIPAPKSEKAADTTQKKQEVVKKDKIAVKDKSYPSDWGTMGTADKLKWMKNNH